MRNHDGRSYAASPPPVPVPQRWQRPDVPRPGRQDSPEGAAELDPPGDMLLDPPEALHAAELFGLLPQPVRCNLRAGLEGARS